MPHGNPYIDPRIKEAKRQAAAAQSKMRRTIRQIQAECWHQTVVEAPYQRSEWLWPMPAIRCCVSCGLTEYGRYGSSVTNGYGTWQLSKDRNSMESDYKTKPILANKFASPVTRDEIRKYMEEVPHQGGSDAASQR